MELRGDRVVLRPLEERDVDRIVELGADPEVARWWPGLTPEDVGEKARGEEKDVVSFAIVVDGDVAGMIQHWEETEPDYRHAGIDLFLGTPYHDRGLGTDAVRTMARYLIESLGHHRLTIDPRHTTSAPSVATRRPASSASESCANTGSTRTASGRTDCCSTCSRPSSRRHERDRLAARVG